ncbi:MAG: FAD-linked oxidase C-terminal domain-containing protein [Pseudomonadota bacterium]
MTTTAYDPALDAVDGARTADPEGLLRALRQHFPSGEDIITGEEALRPFECDGLTMYREPPLCAVLATSADMAAAVLRLCHRHAVPVVTRGAGTGLSGGALPMRHAVLLVMSRMNRILSIDEKNLTARVQPGVTNRAITEAVAPLGLYYAPDPSSQIACTIGGNVAENSGGVHCLKYGLTVHNVLAAHMLTADGEAISLGNRALDGPGYDLLALTHGSEGMLGVITEVTVRLLPTPPKRTVLLASFDDVATAARAVAQVIAAGILPAGLEMMDQAATCAAEDFVHAGYPRDAAAILLCELDGSAAQVEHDAQAVSASLREAGARDVRRARDEEEQERFWSGRKAAFPAVGRIANDYYCMDGTIPRRALADVLTHIEQLAKRHELRVANVFHAGDGNLHPLILFDANEADELARAEAFGSDILTACVEVGGTITGEHGVGREKINEMCLQFTEAELNQFHAVKRALDPEGLLNPGKAVPTLARCAEFGAMHVHGGQLPHPELERF